MPTYELMVVLDGQRKVDGFYAVRQFTHPGKALPILQEIERAVKIEEALLRHLVIRVPKTKKPIPFLSRPEAASDARPDWGGARRGWRPPRPERPMEEGEQREGGREERYGRRDRPERVEREAGTENSDSAEKKED
jgi:hypothetical protein